MAMVSETKIPCTGGIDERMTVSVGTKLSKSRTQGLIDDGWRVVSLENLGTFVTNGTTILRVGRKAARQLTRGGYQA